MELSTHNKGDIGEQMAVELLTQKGFDIIEQNYRFGRGEIDIIAKDGDVLVFVEVKLKKNLNYGTPEDAVTPEKIRQVRKIAQDYLYQKNISGIECRFDVVAILELVPDAPVITHYKDAF